MEFIQNLSCQNGFLFMQPLNSSTCTLWRFVIGNICDSFLLYSATRTCSLQYQMRDFILEENWPTLTSLYFTKHVPTDLTATRQLWILWSCALPWELLSMMWIVLDNIHYFMLSGTDIEFKEKLFQQIFSHCQAEQLVPVLLKSGKNFPKIYHKLSTPIYSTIHCWKQSSKGDIITTYRIFFFVENNVK